VHVEDVVARISLIELSRSDRVMVAVGFSPRIARRMETRRVATLEPALGCGMNRSVVAPRRRLVCFGALRGL